MQYYSHFTILRVLGILSPFSLERLNKPRIGRIQDVCFYKDSRHWTAWVWHMRNDFPATAAAAVVDVAVCYFEEGENMHDILF